ncbi:hypothetical protein GF337_20135 [candidate division KSB1 bacterium]|nr:hypothetical protein [candidate division KSB1 bacterium]
MVDRICDDTYQGIHSILIVKNDKIVFGQYFKYDYDLIQSEAPISEKIKIVEPPQSLKNNIAKLSGHWYGFGDYLVAGQLVVEKIDFTQASVIYAWGDHPDGYFKRGWKRKSAIVDSNGEIEFQLNDAILNFKLDKNEEALHKKKCKIETDI